MPSFESLALSLLLNVSVLMCLMVLFSSATFKMSPFDPNTENQKRAGETESNQTSEDTSEEREGFPLSDDTAIRHNICHSDTVQQFPFPRLPRVCLHEHTCAPVYMYTSLLLWYTP